jgi:hypothetical protein
MRIKFRPLGRRECRCEEKINVDLKEARCEDVVWIHLDSDRDLCPAVVNKNNEYAPTTFVSNRL